MKFNDRIDAGRQLARYLAAYADREDTVVLGIPRGGVPVAFEVANALHAPLDIFLSRKLGTPANEELAFGAVAAEGDRYLDREIIRHMSISDEQIETITERTRQLIEERAGLYRGGRAPVPVAGKIVILVDDGIATGASISAAIHALRQRRPRRLVVASPVAPASTCSRLQREADTVIVAHSPEEFHAVGQFYRDFAQTTDSEVIDLLRRSRDVRPPQRLEEPVSIPLDRNILDGDLRVPAGARTLVIFAHGSGSSRLSPRNREVASTLNRWGMATLLFDLLTPFEEHEDRASANYRFNIGLLTQRLLRVTEWAQRNPRTAGMRIAFFGASTGAAAALSAAAQLPDLAAVVSRGGRPDLAGGALSQVTAPTLLLVGSRDEAVITHNREALRQLSCKKQLTVVPGASHLFEEPGALSKVANLAAEWISQASTTAATPPMRRPPVSVRPHTRAALAS